jgi:hypothetical protein
MIEPEKRSDDFSWKYRLLATMSETGFFAETGSATVTAPIRVRGSRLVRRAELDSLARLAGRVHRLAAVPTRNDEAREVGTWFDGVDRQLELARRPTAQTVSLPRSR